MIRSTFSSFITAQSGLNASQMALDITGHNMTNVNTSGYTRQRVDLLSVSAGGYTNRYSYLNASGAGQGVNINGISQVRDPFLDVRFRREHARLGEVEAQYSVLYEMESVFNEVSIDGLKKGIENFVSQLQKYSDNAGSSEFDGIVRSSAEMLTKLFNDYSRQLSQVRESQNYQLESIDIPRVNKILENLTTLNKSIREDQTYGNPSLELMDQRNLLLDELSQYMKIDVTYTPVEIAKGIVVEDVSVRLVTEDVPAQYVDLIQNLDHATFSTDIDPVTGEASILLEHLDGSVADITDKIQSGVLKGTLDMLNMSGEFDTPASTEKGIGYYTQALDELAEQFAKAFNDANADPNATPPIVNPLFTNINDDSTTGITAANISISQGWLKSEYGITTTKREVEGNNDGANDNILRMISLFEKNFDFKTPGGDTIFNGTFQQYFAQIGNTLAIDTQAKQKTMDTFTATLNGVLDLREGVSNVSLDEEGINLLRYQQSYNAAARFMTTLDEALDKLINGTGVVGR